MEISCSCMLFDTNITITGAVKPLIKGKYSLEPQVITC